jgi:hypothetical protein
LPFRALQGPKAPFPANTISVHRRLIKVNSP